MITPQSAWRLTAPLRRGAYGGEKSLPFVGEVAEQSEDGEVLGERSKRCRLTIMSITATLFLVRVDFVKK